MAVAAAGISTFALLYAPQPVLPQLAGHFGLTPGGASLAISVATGALAITVLPIAAVSEVVGRRPIIVTSLLASVLLGLLLPLAPTFPAFLALRAIQGVAIAGFPGVAAAYLVERLGRAGVAAAVGAMIAGNTLGGMLGRLASGFAAASLGWRGSLLVVATTALFFALPGVLLLPRVREQGSFATAQRKQGSLAHVRGLLTGIGHALREPVLLAQYVVAFLAMGSFVALYNAAGFRLTRAPLSLSPAAASLVFLSYAMGSCASAGVSRLASRVGRARILVSALVVTVAGGVLTLFDPLPLVVIGFVVLTGGFFAAHAVANGWAAAEHLKPRVVRCLACIRSRTTWAAASAVRWAATSTATSAGRG
jgi:YNFM family putative membrane transporter